MNSTKMNTSKKTYELPEELSRLVQDFLRPDINKMRHKTKMRKVVKSLKLARLCMARSYKRVDPTSWDYYPDDMPPYLVEYEFIKHGISVACQLIEGVWWYKEKEFIEPVQDYIIDEVGFYEGVDRHWWEYEVVINPDEEYEREIAEWFEW